MSLITDYKVEGTDFGTALVPKSYLIDRYPELADAFRFAGLWMFGYNNYGQIGDNSVTFTNKSSPVQTVSGGTNWKQVSCGNNHTAAIKTDGTLWTWGYNVIGQLGDNTIVDRSSPVQTTSGGTNWKQVACGSYHTAAIKTNGTLWIWGGAGAGQLGNETTSSKSSPIQTVAGGTNWKQVSCGNNHTAAIKTDGTLWIWGYLSGESIVFRSSPIQTVASGTNWKQVSCGGSHTAAIKTDGTLWVWGANDYGQLGDETTNAKSSPIQTVASGTNWKQVSCGSSNITAIKTDGTLWIWGWNNYGALGDNTVVDKSSPVQTVAGGTNWKQVNCGNNHTAAIKTDGTLWTWGFGRPLSGQSKSSPVQTISGGTNWKQVSSGTDHTAAIRDDSSDLI